MHHGVDGGEEHLRREVLGLGPAATAAQEVAVHVADGPVVEREQVGRASPAGRSTVDTLTIISSSAEARSDTRIPLACIPTP